MSIDVEEWFHIPSGIDNIIPYDQWDNAMPRVQDVLPRILDIFNENRITATFFFLGWIAKKYPALVKETLLRGHEIATHGYAHKLIYNQTRDEFDEDIYKAKTIIEDISGRPVIGYRAPGFSITPGTKWAFEILAKYGFKYDSSIFPGKRAYGYYKEFKKEPVVVRTSGNEIIEFPQTVIDFGITKISFFGGGYFRLFPNYIFYMMAKIIKKNDRSLIVYIHPRDIDIYQPEIPFPFFKRIRHYINIPETEKKLKDVAGHFSFVSFEKVISNDVFIEKLTKTVPVDLSNLK